MFNVYFIYTTLQFESWDYYLHKVLYSIGSHPQFTHHRLIQQIINQMLSIHVIEQLFNS